MSEQEIKNALYDEIMAGTALLSSDSPVCFMHCAKHNQDVIVTLEDMSTGNLRMYENGYNYLETLNPRNIPTDNE